MNATNKVFFDNSAFRLVCILHMVITSESSDYKLLKNLIRVYRSPFYIGLSLCLGLLIQ